MLLATLTAGLVTEYAKLAVHAEEPPQASAEKLQFFEAQVRPLLVTHCIDCHGPDIQENGLRLDSHAGLLKGGTRGAAIVPGDAQRSLLIQAVRHVDEDLAMPPEDDPLPEDAQLALARWIDDGAHWPAETTPAGEATPVERLDEIHVEHWGFRPIGDPQPPATNNKASNNRTWAKNAIDQFVLARLEAAGFEPSPRAGRRTLIRRAYFDLIGLPPSYEEVEAFAADESPQAYEELIDRLLAMPEYGQRWGRHWLDIARYSDTKGFVRMNDYDPRYPFAWTYRDYVVRAFNEDVPFDDFLLHQLAADRLDLEEDEQWKLAALGFTTVGRRFFNRRHQIMAERVDLVSRGLLGMTMLCAKCHDHKFDPLSMQDYYALYGVLDSSKEPGVPEMPLLKPAQESDDPRLAQFQAEFAEKVAAREKKLTELRDAVNDDLRTRAGEYLEALAREMPEHADDAKSDAKPVARDEELRKSPDGSDSGVKRWKRWLAQRQRRFPTAGGARDPIFDIWHRLAQLPPDNFADAAAKAVEEDHGININPLLHKALVTNPPKSMSEAARTIGGVVADVHARWKKLQEVDPGDEGFEDPAAEELRLLLTNDSPILIKTDADARRLFTRKEIGEAREANDAIEQVVLKYIDIAPPRAMVLTEGEHPHDVAIHLRGDHNRRGAVAPRRFLKVVEKSIGERTMTDGSGRLELARAIVDPANPLTPRVIVNRIWGWHFGQGLVTTPSDFGTRGSPPSHPELLDYLSRRFMNEGWSMKRLHRLIMTSATYQQTVDDRSECRDVDPLNALLWRMNRRRLEFEPMRDAMLTVSDEIDTTVGGLPFKDINSRRRSVYYYINRRRIDQTLPTFDVAVPESTLAKRDRSTVPQQALYLMNSGFTMKRARALVARLDADVDSDGDTASRVRQLYRWVYGRDPSADELAVGQMFVQGEVGDIAQPAALTEKQKSWQFGFGHYDVDEKQLKTFTPLSHFNGYRWQEGPDSAQMAADTAYFKSDGGRPGRDGEHASVLRFKPSTGAGFYLFRGQLKPGNNARIGDGFDVYIVSSSDGLKKHYEVNAGATVEVRVEDIELGDGDHIDMIVHPRESNVYDDFTMPPFVFKTERDENGNLRGLSSWRGVDDFEQSVPHWITPLDVWEQYAQVLLISNEFMFVD